MPRRIRKAIIEASRRFQPIFGSWLKWAGTPPPPPKRPKSLVGSIRLKSRDTGSPPLQIAPPSPQNVRRPGFGGAIALSGQIRRIRLEHILFLGLVLAAEDRRKLPLHGAPCAGFFGRRRRCLRRRRNGNGRREQSRLGSRGRLQPSVLVMQLLVFKERRIFLSNRSILFLDGAQSCSNIIRQVRKGWCRKRGPCEERRNRYSLHDMPHCNFGCWNSLFGWARA